MESIILYDLEKIANIIANNANSKAIKDTKFGLDYLISNVEEQTLLDMGFEYKGMTNEVGFETPLYKMGNIEAIFIDQILCVYKVM